MKTKKLMLNKQTIAHLDRAEMRTIVAGADVGLGEVPGGGCPEELPEEADFGMEMATNGEERAKVTKSRNCNCRSQVKPCCPK